MPQEGSLPAKPDGLPNPPEAGPSQTQGVCAQVLRVMFIIGIPQPIAFR